MTESGVTPAHEPSSRAGPSGTSSSRAHSARADSSRQEAWRDGSQGWNALSYLIGGALLGAGAGSLAVTVTGFATLFAAGVLGGLVLAGYVIWVRYAQA